MIAQFYDAQTEQSWDLLILERVIDDLQKHDDNLDMQSNVSARVLSYLVKQGVQEKGVGQRFLVGPVNFCTLMPMRAVPFKVVCLLGLNDADYPRTVQPIGFDLVQYSRRQKGDRSRKFDDRYLFLEALLSAREHLYLSYIGRSCFNNEPQMPSILVSELMEYVDRSFCYSDPKLKPSEHLLQQASLQPFNARNYDEHNALQSFNPIWLVEDSEVELTPATALEVVSDQEIDITQFMFTVLNPQKAFYTQTLGLRLHEQALIDKDEEPFILDTLERYFYLDELLECQLRGDTVNLKQMVQRGNLPQAAVGEIQLAKMQQRVQPMVEQLHPHLQQHKEPVEVRLKLGEQVLLGWLDKLYDDKQIFYRSASIKAKDKVKGFLMHCIAQCTQHPVYTHIYGLDERVSFAPIEEAIARQYLTDWLGFYQQCLSQPMPFFVSTAYELIATGDINKAAAKFNGGQYIGFGESEDPYVALNFSNLDEVIEQLQAISDHLLSDIIELAQEQRYADA